MVYHEDNVKTYSLRNLYDESLEEKNNYYTDEYTDIFTISDTNDILNKYIKKNAEYEHYLVEYEPINEL